MGRKSRWKISIFRSQKETNPPKEFICPISGTLMSDPVIISSGQTLERTSLQACLDLGHISPLDLHTFIPNIALKSTILKWCDDTRTMYPPPPDYATLVKTLSENNNKIGAKIGGSERELLRNMAETPGVVSHAATEMNRRVGRFDDYSSSSVESVTVGTTPMLPFTTRPMCFSPSVSGSGSGFGSGSGSASLEGEGLSGDEEFLTKLRGGDVFEIEQGLALLRRVTRTDEEARVSLCTPCLLSAVRPLLISRYPTVCTNAAAVVVNLSLEKANKVRIVRSGTVLPLIDLLKGGVGEAQEHAAGAIFSLALEDRNKMAIGVLGALQPLVHALRAESERTRCDAALALYHLSMVQSNRAKLVKLGAVSTLLSMVRNGDMARRVMLVLCNLAACNEGRSAMLNGNAVEVLVRLLGELESESTRENCVAALYSLSHGSLRFKALAKEAKAREVLQGLEESGSERMREKARKVLMVMRGREEEAEEVDWEGLLEGGVSRTRYRVGRTNCGTNSTEF